ncbi:MAG: hypothetical protein WD035_01690 [Balneolaceae bacterium]
MSLLLTGYQSVNGQEINFGQYGSAYEINVILGTGDLEFNHQSGGPVISGSGQSSYTYTVDLAEAYAVEIKGIRYLDALVEIDGPDYLFLNGNEACSESTCRIPFTLQAAYSNVGEAQNSPAQAEIISLSGNYANVRFPVLQRQHEPPGLPPPPPTEAFNQSLVEETAVLYLYGTIEVGDVDVGDYFSQITITVTYE